MSEIRKSGKGESGKRSGLLEFPNLCLGQRNPMRCPSQETDSAAAENPLGEALGIRQVSRLIGCSVWMVRNRLLARGLPHLRLTPGGRLFFYRNQVLEWLVEIQKERRCAP